MDKPCLNDPSIYPDKNIISHHLGEATDAWNAFTDMLATEFPELVLEWNYYKDGKSWLGKLVKKKKTICWVSIWDKMFKTTFYFNEKNENTLKGTRLSKDLIENYFNQPRIGKIRPLIIALKSELPLKTVRQLIALKEKL